MVFFVTGGSLSSADSHGSMCVESAVIRATATVINPVGIDRVERESIEADTNDISLFEFVPTGCDDEESFLMLRCPDFSHALFQIEADGKSLETSSIDGVYELSDFHSERARKQSQISLVSYRNLFRKLPDSTSHCTVTIIYTEN